MPSFYYIFDLSGDPSPPWRNKNTQFLGGYHSCPGLIAISSFIVWTISGNSDTCGEMEIPHWIYRLFGRCLGIPKKQSKILILGLSGVGKSTLLNEMSVVWPEGRLPTQHLISEELVADNYRFVVSDLGGPQPDRKPWSEILYDVAGIIFLVDATDRERFAEAKAELGALVFEKETYKIPILVMGTGIDSRYAVSEDALRSELELEIVRYRLFELRTCSVFGAIGLWDGLDWLRDRIELRDWE